MNDDWRVHARLPSDDAGRELTERLKAFDREHQLGTAFDDRVVVSRDGSEVFAYTGTREHAEAAESAIRSLATEHGWETSYELRHWHPVAEEWEDPDQPLPASDADVAAEHAEVVEREREESAEQGYPEYEVRVRCATREQASRLAETLRAEGFPIVHRDEFIVLGAADEDSAQTLAARVRAEAPAGTEVTAEGSVSEVVAEAPFATPYSPFAVFGGLGG